MFFDVTYDRVARGLMQEDRLLFALSLLTIRLEEEGEDLDGVMVDFLLGGGGDDELRGMFPSVDTSSQAMKDAASSTTPEANLPVDWLSSDESLSPRAKACREALRTPVL